LPGEEVVDPQKLDGKRVEIERLGFKVVRVPYLVSLDPNSVWPGVSYVNSLATDGLLFVPTFGLPQFEEQILADLTKRLRGLYQVIPVDSRYNLTYNGGVHCTFGIVRAAAGS
jgi:agmatine/peptidylarginine deiminase